MRVQQIPHVGSNQTLHPQIHLRRGGGEHDVPDSCADRVATQGTASPMPALGPKKETFIMSFPATIANSPLHQQAEPPFQVPFTDLQDLLNVPPIDIRLLLEQCMNKPSFAIAMLEQFALTGNDRVEEMAHHLVQADLTGLADRAHSLKGVAGILAANTLAQACAQVEAACRNSDVDQVQTWLANLQHEMRRVLDDIPMICAVASSEGGLTRCQNERQSGR